MPSELALLAVIVICGAVTWFLYEIVTAPHEINDEHEDGFNNEKTYRDY